MREWFVLFLESLTAAVREFTLLVGPWLKRRQFTNAEAVALFKENPLRWFRNPAGPYTWTSRLINNERYHPADISIYVGDMAIGFVEGIVVFHTTKTATVRHIAVSKGLEGQGLGFVIAHALRLCLVNHYQVKTILFEEDSSKYQSARYPAFFSRLGAKMIVVRPGGRPSWRWE